MWNNGVIRHLKILKLINLTTVYLLFLMLILWLDLHLLQCICIHLQNAIIARGYLSVCPSVRPSRSGVLSRRMNLQSCSLQHVSFLMCIKIPAYHVLSLFYYFVVFSAHYYVLVKTVLWVVCVYVHYRFCVKLCMHLTQVDLQSGPKWVRTRSFATPRLSI